MYSCSEWPQGLVMYEIARPARHNASKDKFKQQGKFK